MPSIEGVRKVNEWVMQDGRTIVITDNTVNVGDVPAGTLFSNPSGIYGDTDKQLMIKAIGGTSWSIIDPANVFAKGSMVNSLLGAESVWTANIKKGNVTRDRIDDVTGAIIDNALYVNASNIVSVDRATPITVSMYGDITLFDKVIGTAPHVNRTLTVEGKINTNSDIVSQTAVKSIGQVNAGTDVTAANNISAGSSISAVRSITAGTDVSGDTVTARTSGTVGTSFIVGKTVNSVDVGSIKSIGSIESTQDTKVGRNLNVVTDIIGGNNLTLSKRATIGTSLSVGMDATIGTTLTVTGLITGQDALSIGQGITASKDIVSTTGALTSYGDITSNNGSIYSKQGSISAYKDIVASTGNITSTAGIVSAGNGVIIKKGGLNVQADGATIAGNVSVVGTISADRVYDAVMGDLAEGYLPAEKTEPGDILEITDDFKVKKAGADSTTVIGVHSECYASCYLASEDDIKSGKKVAVGIIGQAPIKIVGKAMIGQLVVSAGSGIGKVVRRSQVVPGTVVGKVLENKEYEGLGLVMCFIFPA